VFCVYCMTFDSVMLLLPFFAGTRLRLARAPGTAPPLSWRLGAAVVLVLGALSPALVGHFLKPHVPDAILKLMEQTPRGKVTIVDFVDFECPYCRMTHATLAPLLAREADHVRLVRVNMPLTRIHAHADIAARAEICGERLAGKPEQVDALVDRLFTLPEEELALDPLVTAAGEVGLDAAAFGRCLADPTTAARLADDAAVFKSVGGRGLPLLYIDTRRIEGAQEGPVLEGALRQAEAAK
jgi:predicted DsbA family dithiol-disulfide isomerase